MPIDRRVVRTRTALYDALVSFIRERDYSDIRVEDILTRANVGRSTFYAHFKSKDDLLERSLERLRGELMAVVEAAPSPNMWAVSLALFRHIDLYRDIHFSLAGGTAGHILHDAMAGNFSQVLRSILPSRRAAIPRELAIAHATETFAVVLRWWLDRNPSESPDTAAEMFRRLVSNGLGEDWPELTGE